MPIFEYVCQDCAHGFEVIVRGLDAPQCPSCHGERLQKQLSVFAVNSKSAGFTEGPAPGACGSCGDPRGAGACSLN